MRYRYWVKPHRCMYCLNGADCWIIERDTVSSVGYLVRRQFVSGPFLSEARAYLAMLRFEDDDRHYGRLLAA